MNAPILRFKENRVRRAYPGGLGIDKIHGKKECRDGFLPEEWIGSLVEAINTGMERIKGEGISCAEDGRTFADILSADPVYYLGKSHFEHLKTETGFLVKFLDSAVRLPLQAHPSREYARRHLKSPWGKLECYFILDVRENIDPYIYLGFQNPPAKEEWRDMILAQDLKRIEACFERIPVKKGEFWRIPPGLPHAIGEGILMIEIMEPSDWVIRCEFEPVKGRIFPPAARYMGKGIDEVLDVFDYTPYSIEKITGISKMKPVELFKDGNADLKRLIDYRDTDCFEALLLNVNEEFTYRNDGRFFLGIVIGGGGKIEADGFEEQLCKGDSFMIAAASEKIEFIRGGAESFSLCMILPGKYSPVRSGFTAVVV